MNALPLPPPSPPPSPPPEDVNAKVKLELDISASDFGVLVGKNGDTLKRLRNKWDQVAIHVPRATATVGSKATLEGPSQACTSVLNEMEAILMIPITSTEPAGFVPNLSSDLSGLSLLRQGGVLSVGEFEDLRESAISHYSGGSSSSRSKGCPSVTVKRAEYLPTGIASLQPGHLPHPGDWECPTCRNVNWAGREVCNRCKTARQERKLSKNTNVTRIIADPPERQASSSMCSAEDGCLAGVGWTAGQGDMNPWYTIDAGSTRVVCGVVLKPHTSETTCVTSFSLSHSADGTKWLDMGIHAAPAVVRIDPVTTRYIKIAPLTWVGTPSMRAGLLLCALAKNATTGGLAARMAAKEKLSHFFQVHNPEKLQNIDSILAYCETTGVGYASLYRRLEAKYSQPAKTRIIVLNVNTSKTLNIRAMWQATTVRRLKEAIAVEWAIPPDLQILTTKTGVEVADDSLPCASYSIGTDLLTVVFLDSLCIDDDTPDDAISI